MEIENKEKSFKQRIIEHNILGYFYNIDPKKTVINICSYSLQSDSRLEFSRQKALKVFNTMRFDSIYERSEINWYEYFNKTFYQMQGSYRAAQDGERIPHFIVQHDIKKIPQHLWTIPSKNQKIKEEEFIFILKTLNFKILKNWQSKRRDFYTLPQNWFLNEGVKQKYKEKTKRKINRHKISRITELLFEYKIIEKYQPWDSKTNKIKPIIYKFGDENFYKRRILSN